jgi:hypothetical protein
VLRHGVGISDDGDDVAGRDAEVGGDRADDRGTDALAHLVAGEARCREEKGCPVTESVSVSLASRSCTGSRPAA